MPNPVVHFEVMGKDSAKLQQFYSGLFDWKIQNMAEMGNYGMVEAEKAGEMHGIGGGIGASQDGSSLVTFYVEVADPQAFLDKAVSMGGSVAMPVTDMGMVVVAMFSDPEGHMIGLVKSGTPA